MQFPAFGVLLVKSTLLMTLLQGCRSRSTMCQGPSIPLNGHVLYRSSGSSYVMYKCNPGYVLIGFRASLCMLGRWSPDTPKCVRADKQLLRTAVQVDEPTPSANQHNLTLGSFSEKKISAGDVKRRSISASSSAHANRSCRFPPLISKGQMIVSRFRPNEVTYVCERGYFLSKRHTMYCENGIWDQEMPRCVHQVSGHEAPFSDYLDRLDNLCEKDFGGCDQLCYFGPRGSSCGCHRGYTPNGTRCHDIDECETRKEICPNKCVNTPGSYHCTCVPGYAVGADGKTCVDINECAMNNGGCQRVCENTMGSFRCLCDIWGYDLAPDGKTCIRHTKWIENYCAYNNGGCAHECRSGKGKAICSCRDGYKLSGDNKNCDDIDECYNGIAKCQHRCRNTLGSFECECHPGYIRSNINKTQCIDIDECKVDKFGCAHVCVNEPGTARCECHPGFRLQEDGKNCEDSPPPPEVEGSGFDSGETLNYDQEYFSPVGNTCPHGYERSENGCKDMDECPTAANNCSVRCVNTPGGFYCACNKGYNLREDGISCVDIDECSTGTISCTGECVNTPGSYYCECPAGHSLGEDGRSCDECPVNTYKNAGYDRCVRCPANSRTNGTGKSSMNDCVCNKGYEKSLFGRIYCQDIDECRNSITNCSKLCVNTPGGFHCACPRGYSLAQDGTSCDDINECAKRDLHNCQEECVNTIGSYRCACRPGRVPYGINSNCQDCPPGTYKEDKSEQCEKCPANSHTLRKASASMKDCICNQGYRGRPADGHPCQDIDECKEGTLRCSHDCVNILGSAFCSCPLGLRLKPDNLTCEDIDECTENPRVCSQLCTNTYGSYVCSCNQGYTLSSSDSYQCIDNDECATKKHGCSHTCVNFDGGYYCKCPEGFQMTADLRTCAHITCPMFIDVPNSVTKCDRRRVDSSVPIGTQCTVHCNAGFELEGHADTVCSKNGTWTTELPTCKPLHCPPIQSPEHGSVLPDRCLQSDANYFKSRCYFQCNEGYKLDGFAVTTCQKNSRANPGGQGKDAALAWNRKPALCKKETPAIWITCPPSTTFVLPPGQSSMQPDIPLPNTNVEQGNVKLEIDDPNYVNGTLPYGDTKVTYVATRPETNKSIRCTFEVTIDDKEPPEMFRCPTTVSAVATSLEGVTVTWEEPEFLDNVEVDTVEKSKEPGSLFNAGLHIVYYAAKDTAGNEAVCKFQVNVTHDITLWTPKPDSLGKLQDALQEAADIITEHVHAMGLKCAPQKTELLFMKRGNSPDPEIEKVYLTIEGQKVYPTCKPVRILGLHIQANNRWTHQINLLKQQLDQLGHMIRRVTTRHRGMREADTLRLVQAFAVSRVVYVAPYMNLLKSEQARLETMLRKVAKTALHLPASSSTQRFMEMGAHNTLAELVEAHRVNQLVRLGKTPAGKTILSQLNLTPIHVGEAPKKTPPAWRSLIDVRPIPKNMHPEKHKGRREARAKALNKMIQYIAPNRVAYTDAALICAGEVVAVACTGDDNSKVACLHTTIGEEILIGEQVAIALAVIQQPRYIYTDSQDACRAYLRGRICPDACHILETYQPPEGKRTISIIWTPSHTETEVKGNARAHHLAREEAGARALVSGDEDPEERMDPPTPLTSYKSITKYYREQRRTLPPPHQLLDKGEQVKWRLLQSNTYPTPSRMNLLYPQLYPSPTCPNCQQARGTIYHMVLACPNHPAPQDAARLRDHPWETAIRASDAEGQRLLISLAEEACKANGTPDVGTSPG